MTTIENSTTPGGDPATRPSSRRHTWVDKGKLYFVLYALIAPTLVGMLIFNYYPKFEAIFMSLYDWDGQDNRDFVGLKNFADLFTGRDPLFWPTFQLVGILLVANAVKMWPSIFAAITLHRLRSEKWQYIYRVLFVLPMVIPSLVWLLVWKNFFDPNVGVMNKMLNATGLMYVLDWFDKVMPRIASLLSPLMVNVIDPVFGNVWAMLLFGTLVTSMAFGARGLLKAWVWWAILALTGTFLFWGARSEQLRGLPDTAQIVSVLLSIAIPFLVAVVTGLVLERTAGSRGLLVMKWTGLSIIIAGSLLVLLTKVWYTPTYQFSSGAPAWLSNEKLVIPSLIIWGFPWIGTVGVLIYLAGLQSISQDVYEAAELDGVSSLGKMFRIELPLIMTQVRINLIFMTIGTLTDYGLILLLLGPDGGPSNVGMVPGLYMYKKAFIDARFGYACAIGMVMFALILLITVVYQKYVKVEK